MAVVDDSTATPPAELVLAWWCSQYNALPESGGVMDQDYQTFARMQVLLNVHGAVTRLRSSKGEEIHNLSRADRRILKMLKDQDLLPMGLS